MKIKLTHHDNAAYTCFHLPKFSCSTLCYEVTALQTCATSCSIGCQGLIRSWSGNFPICHMSRPILGVSQPPIHSPGIQSSFPRKRIGLNLTTQLYLQLHFYSCRQCFVGWFPNSHKLFLIESITISFGVNMWLPGLTLWLVIRYKFTYMFELRPKVWRWTPCNCGFESGLCFKFPHNTVFDQPVCQSMWPSSSQIVLSSLTVWCIALGHFILLFFSDIT
jgi:hypothetical protein